MSHVFKKDLAKARFCTKVIIIISFRLVALKIQQNSIIRENNVIIMSFWLFGLCLSKIGTVIRANSNETLVLQISVKCHRGCCPSDLVALRGCRPCKPPENAIRVVGHLILLPRGVEAL